MENDQLFLDDPVKFYLAEVNKVPPVTRAEEILCIQQIRAGGPQAASARTRLLEANLHLVVAIVEQYQKHNTHILELIEKGNEGLLHALQNLSNNDQDSFKEHAKGYIQEAIKRAIESPEIVQPVHRDKV